MIDWLRELLGGWNLVWFAGFFVVTLVGSIGVVLIVVVNMPADYFASSRRPVLDDIKHPVWRWIFLIGSNLIGYVLILLGIIMLVAPGQGVLTILLGVIMIRFPGKRRLERWLIGRPAVLAGINRLRERFGKPPLTL